MMSPATGLVVSELVRHGESRTSDITPFAVDRFANAAPWCGTGDHLVGCWPAAGFRHP